MKKLLSALFVLFVLPLIPLSSCRAYAATYDVYNLGDLEAALLSSDVNTIELRGNIGMSSASHDFEISHELTINGNNNTIDGSNYRIFRVNAGTVKFSNVRFTATGAANTAGEAINISNGNVTFDNGSSFTGNRTTAVNIGSGVTVTFDGTAFSGSTSGDVVKVDGGTATFTNGRFENNSSRAVSITGGAATFTGTPFTGNAGAVSVTGGTAAFNAGVSFTNNDAGSNDGGAVYVGPGGKASFAGNVEFNFNRNRARDGGALWLYSFNSSNVDFGSGAKFSFENNNASGSGGAIYVSSSSISLGDSFKFTNNEAASGGALYSNGNVTVTSTDFSGNRATGSGGALYSTANVAVSGGAFTTNTAGRGGAIYSDADVSITGGILDDNQASESGGAVYGRSITVNPAGASMTFRGNNAGEQSSGVVGGGAFYSSNDITLQRSIFNGNTASVGGAIFSVRNAQITNCVFDVNEGITTAGAIYSGSVEISGSSFTNNTAAKGSGGAGGAVFVSGTSGASKIESSYFSANLSNVSGGAVYMGGDGPSIEITGSYFANNSSNGAPDGGGGALYLAGSDILISRSTFVSNSVKPGATANGGAAFLKSAKYSIANSTFVGNEAGSGKGGALYLSSEAGSDSGKKSVVLYATFVDNKAGGGMGGGLYYAGRVLNLGASLFVGNIAGNGFDDVTRDVSVINSLGYNIVGVYGILDSSGTSNGNYNWTTDPYVEGSKTLDNNGPTCTRAVIFGNNTLAANNSGVSTVITAGSSLDPTKRHTIDTVALTDSTEAQINPALDRIAGIDARNTFNSYFSGDHIDARGVFRAPINSSYTPSGGSRVDIGAYETIVTGEGGGTDPPGSGVIAYVRMSGIPNFMVRVGQTCSLTAVVYYANGESSVSEGLTWESSNPGVARIDDFGNMVSLRTGTTVISVTTARYGSNNERKTDSATLTVSETSSYTNIHPDLWGRMADFNAGLASRGAQIYFKNDENPSDIEESAFASSFMSIYGVNAHLLTELDESNGVQFISSPAYDKNGLTQMKPAIGVELSTLTTPGAILPMRFAYSIEWSDVSQILGKNVTSAGLEDVKKLFQTVSFVFEDENGDSVVLVDTSGSTSITADRAISGGVLSYSSGNTLNLTLDLFIADAVSPDGESQPEIIGDKLVVADNDANSRIKGLVWLLEDASSGGNQPGGGGEAGGGGCAAGSAAAAVIFMAAAAVCFKRRI
ncbi:MAG: hypothetical protein LBQ58_03290 [Synergistaceae bacterium]|nr:hypothetical protein [Synergistaceae bacterium]